MDSRRPADQSPDHADFREHPLAKMQREPAARRVSRFDERNSRSESQAEEMFNLSIDHRRITGKPDESDWWRMGLWV